jgi:hypothetical protein
MGRSRDANRMFLDLDEIMKKLLIALATTVALAGPATAGENPRFIWPKNDQFTCRGELTRDKYQVLQLAENPDNLTWCDAEITEDFEAKVLKVCAVGSLCEIKGSIRGHGTFVWVKIRKIQLLKWLP